MEIKDVYDIWEKFEQSDINEIKVMINGDLIELKKSNNHVKNVEQKTETKINTVNSKKSNHYYEIKAPFVGTFFSSPSPESEPFVKIGDEINKGDVLCIVEAMKIMNEINSPIDGKIIDIKAENNDFIEYNQVLFVVEELDV